MTSPIAILVYHSVSDMAAPRFRPYAITPNRFAAHMQVLVDAGFETLTVSDLVQTVVGLRKPPNRPTAVVTFDDGYSDFADAAWPVLDRLGLAATLYVTTGYVGGTSRWMERIGEGGRPMLGWTRLRSLASSGIEVGAHGHTHRELDALPSAEAKNEIVRSKQELEEGLGRRVESFAYPHGYHDATVRHFVIEAGFSSASAVKEASSSAYDDPFALSRFTIKADTSSTALGQLLNGESTRTAPRQEHVRTNLWRRARRVGHSTGIRRLT